MELKFKHAEWPKESELTALVLETSWSKFNGVMRFWARFKMNM